MIERIVKCRKQHHCYPCKLYAIPHQIAKGELAYVSSHNDYFCKKSLLEEGWPEEEITVGILSFDD